MSGEGAWIITIGDELLRGEIVDSNKSFLSERLLQLDLEARRHVTVADDAEAISEVLLEGARRARVVLVTGGLGPTRDDITTRVAARSFGRELVRDPDVIEGMRRFFQSMGREMAANNAKQADFPDGADILLNPLGTAPGFMLEAEGALLFFMPGVPRELYRMMDEEVLPRLRARLGRAAAVRAVLLRTFGIGESNLDRLLDDLVRDDPHAALGFRTQFPDNLIRVVARGDTDSAAQARLEALVEQVRTRLGDVVLGEGERGLEEIVGALLLERRLTIAVAESATGGLLSSRLTDVPGSGAYLLESMVTCSDEAKLRDLGVGPDDLARGAVSETVALQMAEGVRKRAGTDIGLATTGVAGPGEGNPEIPVGTVCIGLADGAGSVSHRYALMRERSRNKQLATQLALDWVRRRLLGLEITAETFPRLRGREGGSA